VEIIAALDSERARARTTDQKSEIVALGIKTALGDCDQRACERLSLRRNDQTLKPLVGRQRPHARRYRDRDAARRQTVLRVVETHDLIDALDSDVKRP